MARPVALTGTPGTGKTRVAGALDPWRSVEVGALARRWGCAQGSSRGGVTVDVRRLARRARAAGAFEGVDVVVGHLAHLLPLRDVVVLRCHPLALARRLERARRGGARERLENVVAEATDVVRWEAVGPGRRVVEVDTTSRSVASVARSVSRFVRSRVAGPQPRIDWLADPAVTDYLLDRAP